MACTLRSMCSVEDVAAVQKFLFGSDDQEELPAAEEEADPWNEDSWTEGWDDLHPADAVQDSEDENDWLQKCKVAFSPTYDLLAIAFERKVVLFTAKSDSTSLSRADGLRRYKISNQEVVGDEPGEQITSILCIPLVSLKKTSHGNVDWSCVVIGFSSGYIRIYTEGGVQLISQVLHESPVIQICCRTQDLMVARRGVEVIDQPDEITILYGDAVILLEGFSLFQTLRACRSQVALATASGGISIEPPPLSYKKWRLTGNQTAISSHISPGIFASNPFDHMRTASILGGYHAEIRGSSPVMSCFVTVGSAPYTGFYYAVEGSAQPHLSHVAFAVASKLKSALYNSASRWLAWGTGTQQEPEQKQKAKPKVELGSPLDIRCGMPDALRHGDNIILAPGAHMSSLALAATTDSLGRVILMDITRAIALRMWKGYRDAQVGFIRVFDDAHRGHRHGEGKTARRHALFLLIYAPRRGVLEIWTCINGPRVGAFNVSKNARLLCPGFGMLGINTSTMYGTTAHTFQCCLLEPNGIVKEFVIPFHLALSDANSKKARDMHLLKKLSLILHSRKRTGEEAVKILLELRITGMIRQALEKLLHTRRLGVETFRTCLTSIKSRLSEGGTLKKPENDLVKYCDVQLNLISLYDSMHKLNETSNKPSASKIEDVSNADILCNLLQMTRSEAEDALSAVSQFLKSKRSSKVSFQEEEKPTLDVAEFLDFFLVCEPVDKDSGKEWTPTLKSDESKYVKLGSFLFHSSLFGSSSVEDVLFTLSSLDLKPKALLNLLFKYWLSQTENITGELSHCIQRLHNFVESSCKKAISSNGGKSDSSPIVNQLHDLWKWIQDDICASSKNCVGAYFLALVARAVVIAHRTQNNKEEKESSDTDDWEKMQNADDEEVEPPSYEESLGKKKESVISDDWETLWIDVENWNLLVSQLHDSVHINTAISLGNNGNSAEPKSEQVQGLEDHRGDAVSIRDLLSNGTGYMAELVSHSVWKLGLPPFCIAKDANEKENKLRDLTNRQKEFFDFLHTVLYPKFPFSLAPDCLHSHCFWALIVEWNKDPISTHYLTTGIEHLSLIDGDIEAQHGLALMTWKTFIIRRFIALLKLVEKVGKAPKDRLCRKEVGISDVLMPEFCEACTNLLQIIADSDQTPPTPTHSPGQIMMEAEDPWQDVQGKRSIMDMGRAHPRAHIQLVQHIMHVSFVLHATMQFSLRGVKPISSLFDQRGKACMAVDLTTKDPELPDNDNLPSTVIKSRQHFLGKIVSGAVKQLSTCVLEKEEVSIVKEKRELESWIITAIHMAVEFRAASEKIKIHHVDELLRYGLDSIAYEACMEIADKEVLSSSLTLIVGQRLSYILLNASAENSVMMMAAMSPTLCTWIRSQDSALLKRPDVPLEDTAILARKVLEMMSENHAQYRIASDLKSVASSIQLMQRMKEDRGKT